MAETMKLHLKRLSIWPVIKVTFLISLVFGFVLGLFYALLLAFIFAIGSAMEPYGTEELGMASAGAMLVFMPLFLAFFTAVTNSILALVGAACYNFVARTMGGYEYDVEIISSGSDEPSMRPATPSSPPDHPSPAAPPQQEPPTDYSI